MGLLDNYNEAMYVFEEAVELDNQSPASLRILFVMLTMQTWPTASFIDRNEHPNWVHAPMMDFLEQSHHNAHQAYNMLLQDIQERLDANCGKANTDFGLPSPANARTELERELLKYDPLAEANKVATARASLTWTDEMEAIYRAVVAHLDANTGDVMFILGKAGVGKTTLNRILLSECRSRGSIGLVCAPTALAASLYASGMTCHEACKLSIVEDEQWDEYTSFLQKIPSRRELLQDCRLLIIDEVFNLHRGNYQAMISALKATRNSTHPSAGMIIVCSGDIHQIAPVVKNGSKDRVLNASVVALPNWPELTKFHLTIPQRTLPSEIMFRTLLDKIGGGTKPHISVMDSQTMVELEDVTAFTNEVEATTWAIPRLTSAEQNVILTASNKRVNELNALLQDRNPHPKVELHSSDAVKSTSHEDLVDVLSPELIANNRNHSVPPHMLVLKKGDVCFLMATLSKKDGIVKNQRLRIIQLGTRLIQAELLLEGGVVRRCLIPRFRFSFKFHQHLEITRLQFPLRLAYAMTFNKSQGQTFQRVLMDSKAQQMFGSHIRGGFAHGHLYVALGRVRQMSHVSVLVDANCRGTNGPITANVVFNELLTYA